MKLNLYWLQHKTTPEELIIFKQKLIRHNRSNLLCGERNETVNRIVSKSSKLSQKEYKNWHDWVGKVIYRELCKRLNFEHTTKWYTHLPWYVFENGANKIVWDFGIQMDHRIPAKKGVIELINSNRQVAGLRILRLLHTTEWKSKKVKWETNT